MPTPPTMDRTTPRASFAGGEAVHRSASGRRRGARDRPQGAVNAPGRFARGRRARMDDGGAGGGCIPRFAAKYNPREWWLSVDEYTRLLMALPAKRRLWLATGSISGAASPKWRRLP